jgi:hypothetical protein
MRLDVTIIVNTKECCEFHNLTSPTLSDYAKRGCPKIDRGKWDLKAVHDWIQDNVVIDPAIKRQMAQAKLRRELAKAEMAETECKKQKNQLISREEVYEEWALRVGEVRGGLLNFADRLSPVLEHKSRTEIYTMIKDEVWNLLDRYSRAGKHTQKDGQECIK